MSPGQMNNVLVIGAAVQLISEITLDVIGDDIATEVDGVKVTQSSITALASSTLNKALSEKEHA